MRATVYPAHGCLISQLRPVESGTNLLWSRPDAPLDDLPRTVVPGPAYEEFDDTVFAGGWFAMFPLAGIPGVGDTDISMHGEIPRIAWDVTAISPSAVTCETRTSSGWHVERTTTLDGSALTVVTHARNESDRAREVTWGEHPCLDRAAFAGGRLDTSVVRAFITPEMSEPDAARYLAGRDFEWPLAQCTAGGVEDVTGIPLDADGRHDHVCAVLDAPRLSVTAPRLGGRLVVKVDLASTPNLLFWQHYRPAASPWHGDVFGIEMCSAPGRTLDDARAAGAVACVESGGSVSWSMGLEWVAD